MGLRSKRPHPPFGHLLPAGEGVSARSARHPLPNFGRGNRRRDPLGESRRHARIGARLAADLAARLPGEEAT